jgi:hypothetical protein
LNPEQISRKAKASQEGKRQKEIQQNHELYFIDISRNFCLGAYDNWKLNFLSVSEI